MTTKQFDMSLVFPCLNEEKTLKECLLEARRIANESGLSVELVVADNGSIDHSLEIARAYSDVVVRIEKRGYGAALDGGVRAATSEYILVADSDLSYDFTKLPVFLKKLREENYELVLGNRFAGTIMPGAMPWHHKYIGNPVLSFIGRVIFTSEIGDFHCGIRAFKKSSYLECKISSSGMEYASEMIIQFATRDMFITEIPVKLSKDGRDRKPHLRSFRDGFRHLKLMLSLAPQFTLLLPGLLLAFVANLILLIIYFLNQSNDNFVSSAIVPLCCISIVGASLFGLGAISIALRKIEGAGKFKWLPAVYSKTRASVAVGVPSAAMVCGQVVFWSQESFVAQVIGINISASGFILIISALVVRQILSKHWR